jgi:plastocyanin
MCRFRRAFGFWFTLTCASAVGLSACGGGGSGAGAPPAAVPQDRSASQSFMLGGGSGPRTWKVIAGAQSADGADLGLAYYANRITIDAGDSVTWTQAGPAGSGNIEPHTVSFLEGSGLTPGTGPLTIPDVANWTSEQCGSPPAACSGAQVEDGTRFNSSPLMYTGGQTYTLTFTRPGTYVYTCLIHYPEMEGVVKVQHAGSPYPATQAQYDLIGSVRSKEDLFGAALSTLQFPFRPGGTTLAAGISPGLSTATKPSNLVVVRFLDSSDARDTNVIIRVGQTVTWVNEDTNDPHTITFPVVGQPDPNSNPFALPCGGTTYNGNGDGSCASIAPPAATNSGLLLPGQRYSLTFTAKGTFTYYCELHDILGMVGTITVK